MEGGPIAQSLYLNMNPSGEEERKREAEERSCARCKVWSFPSLASVLQDPVPFPRAPGRDVVQGLSHLVKIKVGLQFPQTRVWQAHVGQGGAPAVCQLRHPPLQTGGMSVILQKASIVTQQSLQQCSMCFQWAEPNSLHLSLLTCDSDLLSLISQILPPPPGTPGGC